MTQTALEAYPQFDRSYGSLYDRGRADSYYGRGKDPHWYPNGTYTEPEIKVTDPAEVAEYNAGYDENEREGNFKNWGYESW